MLAKPRDKLVDAPNIDVMTVFRSAKDWLLDALRLQKFWFCCQNEMRLTLIDQLNNRTAVAAPMLWTSVQVALIRPVFGPAPIRPAN
jgi:hypothetical protein